MGVEADDRRWMRRALELAHHAAANDEVPVGAVIVQDDKLIAEAWNNPIGAHDPTAHAEINALRKAGEWLQSYRLVGATMYVTLEPCAMCAGAIIHARIRRLVYGAPDPKSGACGSVLDVTGCTALNHRVDVDGDVLAGDCGAVLRQFFATRR